MKELKTIYENVQELNITQLGKLCNLSVTICCLPESSESMNK